MCNKKKKKKGGRSSDQASFRLLRSRAYLEDRFSLTCQRVTAFTLPYHLPPCLALLTWLAELSRARLHGQIDCSVGPALCGRLLASLLPSIFALVTQGARVHKTRARGQRANLNLRLQRRHGLISSNLLNSSNPVLRKQLKMETRPTASNTTTTRSRPLLPKSIIPSRSSPLPICARTSNVQGAYVCLRATL